MKTAALSVLEPDRDQLEIFFDAILRHRGTDGFISLRSFHEGDDSKKALRITPVSLKGDFRYLIDCALDDARRAAQFPEPIVFCPPTCVFGNKDNAREQDVLAGLVLSVECDRSPHNARRQLEDLLGLPTVVVRSGGQWIDDDGEVHDKLHLHWRLAQPARSPEDLIALKNARMSAARLVGGDESNNPICHPIRWPGSWHRKKGPRLCTIVAVEPDVEITLAAAIAALPAVTVTPQAHTVEDWVTFIDGRQAGGKYTDSERRKPVRRFAGLMVRYYDPLIAESTVRLFNELRCDPPFSNEEIRRIVEDVAQCHADDLKKAREQRERRS
jgi:hypothetical protein